MQLERSMSDLAIGVNSEAFPTTSAFIGIYLGRGQPSRSQVFTLELFPDGRLTAHDQRGRLRPIAGRWVDPPWCLCKVSFH